MSATYKVVKMAGLSSLEAAVNSHLQAGFHPIGGVTVTKDGDYLQAVYYPGEVQAGLQGLLNAGLRQFMGRPEPRPVQPAGGGS